VYVEIEHHLPLEQHPKRSHCTAGVLLPVLVTELPLLGFPATIQRDMDLDPGTSSEEDGGGATHATGRTDGREASLDQRPSALTLPAASGTPTTTTTRATAAGEGTRTRQPRPDELMLVDWDALINQNPSGWSGERSLLSHVSFPEMDAILGWATHQTGSTPANADVRRPSASVKNPDDSGGEDRNRVSTHVDQEAEHSRLLLPSSSVVMSPPSLLKLLEEKSRVALDPVRYRQIWDDRRWHLGAPEASSPTPPPPPATAAAAAASHQQRAAARVTAPVALGCVLEEAMVERLLPIAQAYVEHCRRHRPLRSERSMTADGHGREGVVTGVDDGSGDRMVEEADMGEANGDDHSMGSEFDAQENQEAEVEAWTVPPDQALCALLLDHGVGHLDDEPAEVERRERVLAYLARWKGTETLIESLRI
jgi:hypothetical protein